jgi:hypothetical protein
VTEGPQRRDRLRLARRRPAPDHVRARLRQESAGPQSETGVSWVRRALRRLRRANWAHSITVIGAALAAVAAIGGLWAQAVATYWSQQTAKDQLSQSREDSVRKTRDQASKVTFWVEHPTGRRENVKLHVVNRSPDPVSEVQVALRVLRGSAGADGEHPLRERGEEELWVLPLASLGPCAETVYLAPNMRLEVVPRNDRKSLDEWPKLSDQGFWRVGSMYFVDSSGKGWIRTAEDLDERSSPPVDPVTHIIYWDDEQVNKADHCEGDSR